VQPPGVDIDASMASANVGERIRSSLGGPTGYGVTVRIRNLASFPVDGLRATADFDRARYDDVRAIDLDRPTSIRRPRSVRVRSGNRSSPSSCRR
jgi:hypothetical protein